MAIEMADNETEALGGIPSIEAENEIVTEDHSEEATETVETEGSDEEVSVSIGEASPASEKELEAPEWVKDLRKQHRELAKRNRELEEQLKQVAPQKAPTQLGEKPTLESCDYDGDKFEAELTSWHERKRKIEDEVRQRENEVENQKKAWQTTVATYESAKGSLKVKDFSDAEDFVKDTLSVTQQGIILQGAKDAALVVYALGKNPAKAQELAAIKDPIKFAFEVARLEKDLKVSTKKAPPPEKVVRTGGTPISGNAERTLERLREEAAKTGNYSKVIAFKKQLKEKTT